MTAIAHLATEVPRFVVETFFAFQAPITFPKEGGDRGDSIEMVVMMIQVDLFIS